MEKKLLAFLMFALRAGIILDHLNLCLAEGDYAEVDVHFDIVDLESLRQAQQAILKGITFYFRISPPPPIEIDAFPATKRRKWRRWSVKKY